jgi:MFS family permease
VPSIRTDPRATALFNRASAALVVLTAVNLLNYLDRYVLSAVLPWIETSFGLSDSQSGFLGSMFMLLYLAGSPFAGYFGDRRTRKWLVAGGVFLWSLATIGSGLVTGYGQLLAMRALVGIGEAGYATVAPSMIADLYGERRRGRILAIFYMAIPVGSALGYIVGGSVGEQFGWRWAFVVAGAPGLVMAVAAALLPEPKRGAKDDGEEDGLVPSLGASLRRIVRSPVWWYDTAGTTMMTFTAGGLAFWMPTFLVRHQQMTPEAAGNWLGLILVAAGLIGTPFGGILGDLAYRRRSGGHLTVCAASLLVSAPLVALIPNLPSTPAVLAVSFVTLFLLALTVGPINAVLVGCVPASVRSTAVALNLLLVHLLGDALSPTLIGWISDASSLALAVGLSAVPLLLGAVVLGLGATLVNRRAEGLRYVRD